MDNDTTKAYALLPQEIRDLITDPSTFATIENIGAKYGLNTVEIGLLAQATGSLLRGETRPNQFVTMIADNLSMPQENAALIAQDLNRDLFNAVKDALKQVHSQESTPPVSPIPTPYPGAQAAALGAMKQPAPPVLPSIPTQQVRPVSPPPLQAMPARPEAIPTQTPSQSFGGVSMPGRQERAATPPPVAAAAPQVLPAPSVSPVRETIPQQPTPTTANNLESKLGGAFTIKKEVMYTQPGSSAPLASTPQAVMPAPAVPKAANTTPNAATNNNPVIPPPIQKDPYRELPA